MSEDFGINNTAPKLTGRDNNYSVNIFFSQKALGLGMESTSGHRRAGGAKADGYKMSPQTAVNMNELGAQQLPQSFHINKQGAQLVCNVEELTPWGAELGQYTDLEPEYTLATSTQWTIAAAGGGKLNLTLDGATASGLDAFIAQHKALKIAIGSPSDPSYYDTNKRVLARSGQRITLEYSLDEAAQAGATVEVLDYIDYKPASGSKLRPYTALAVISGDEFDTIKHFAPDTRVTGHDMRLATAQVGGRTITMDVVPDAVLISGRYQAVSMRERVVIGEQLDNTEPS